MSERAELEQRRAALRADLAAIDARLGVLARGRDDPTLAGLEAEVQTLLHRTEVLDAELLEGKEQLAARRDDLARVQALGGLP